MVDEEIQYSYEIVLWGCPCGREFGAPNEDTVTCPDCGRVLHNGMPRRDKLED